MDSKDVRMCQLLLVNSRLPIRDLAASLDITVQAAHRRFQNLISEGVIKEFTASISHSYLDVIKVYISGKSGLDRIDDIIDALSSSDRTYHAIFTSGGYVFINALLRKMDDLEDYLKMVKEGAGIADPIAKYGGNIQYGGSGPNASKSSVLTKIDYRILYALQHDARKSIADISNEVGLSQKTVKKKLDRMIGENIIELSVHLEPAASEGVPFINFIRLRHGSDKVTFKAWLNGHFGARVVLTATYSSLPDDLLIMTWSKTVKMHNEMTSELRSHKDVVGVTSHLEIRDHYFHTWVDKIVEDQV